MSEVKHLTQEQWDELAKTGTNTTIRCGKTLGYDKLGVDITFPTDAHLEVFNGYSYVFENADSVCISARVGRNGSAYLIMSKKDWESLKEEGSYKVGTSEEFQERYPRLYAAHQNKN